MKRIIPRIRLGFFLVLLVVSCGIARAQSPAGAMYLEDGSWTIIGANSVTATGTAISTVGFNTAGWIPAVVPGVALTSYINAGLIPDPNFGNNQYLTSDTAFTGQNYWYRDEFTLPSNYSGQDITINFDGINWMADVYINGSYVGSIDGAFIRGKFDVTSFLNPGQKNAIAVLIYTVADPGPVHTFTLNNGTGDGGPMTADSPTFIASQGWNWVPTVVGRDIGIWSHVYLYGANVVQIIDPFVSTVLTNNNATANLTIQVGLKNTSSSTQSGVLNGTIVPVSGTGGSVQFSTNFSVPAGTTRTLTLTSSNVSQLSIANPQLWWPNGYGAPNMYNLNLTANLGSVVSDQKTVPFGMRMLTYNTASVSGELQIICNGHVIQCNGGDWGMDESLLRYTQANYNTCAQYSKDMNMVIIRDWAGEIDKDEFYTACDNYGLLVWNDFWLANTNCGPDPNNDNMFIANMQDYVIQKRNHPCLALYVGRNESPAPAAIETAMEAAMESGSGTLDSTRYYIPESNSSPVNSPGPYDNQTPAWYFANRGTDFQAELGLVCVPTSDSMRLTMSGTDLWPMDDTWGVHDYYQTRAQEYTADIPARYGQVSGIEDFCEKAQLFNLETAKAMMECFRANRGPGGIVWMSQAAWPCLICQLYDYFMAPTGAYYGVKHALEPIHIFWNANTNAIEVNDDTLTNLTGATAQATIYNMDGSPQWHNSVPVSVNAGTVTNCFNLSFPASLSPVYFVKLLLTQSGTTLSNNFYWASSLASNSCTALLGMNRANLTQNTTRTDSNGTTYLTTTIFNPSPNVALMTELKVVEDSAPTQRILPILYSDNYISLMPGETRVVNIQFATSLLNGANPLVIAKAWNGDSVSANATTYNVQTLAESNTPGVPYTLTADPNAEGGKWGNLGSTAVGQYVQYMVPNLVAGRTYIVTAGVKFTGTGGQMQLAVSGSSVGAVVDLYNSPNSYGPIDIGTVTPSVSGTLPFQFSVTGQNSSSTGFAVGINYIEVTPLSGITSPTTTPTVAIPPSASPSIVTGTTTTLNVLGADTSPAGEAGLTYTWNVISSPTGVAMPTFGSSNRTNAGASTVATFYGEGNYTFEVSIYNGGNWVNATVNVTVNQSTPILTVSPPSAYIAPSGTQQFSAVETDQFGNILSSPGAITWSVLNGPGSIGTSGLYQASSTSGVATIQAASSSYTYTAVASVDVGTIANVTNGLVGRWNFEELSGTTAHDTSGNSNNGTLTSGLTWVTPGKIGNGCLLFPSNSLSYVHVPDSTTLDPTAGITIYGWANPIAWTGNNRILEKCNPNGVNGGDNQYRLLVENGQLKFDLTGVGTLVSTQALPSTNTWHLIAGTWNGSIMTLYVDNVAVASMAASGTLAVTNSPLDIGAKDAVSTTQGNIFDGWLDDVRVYNRGLSSGEMASLYGVSPPWIAIPAAANSANTLPGATSILSVLGADVNGESTLTYTWGTTGTTPAPVTFSANGTNEAKQTNASFTQSGTYNLQVAVTDSWGQSATSSVTLVVNIPSYAAWQQTWFTPSQLANPAISGTAATPAGDGVSNLLKYALNLDPLVSGAGKLPSVSVTSVGGLNYLSLTYTELILATDITYIPEVSGDLQIWNSGPSYTATVSSTPNPGNLTETVTVRDLVPMSNAVPRFIRLEVASP
ncbi:MAG: LamG-like jellyroll fold domain-containing protein [Chthoniobacteraceae bacterium]|jgi:hypothetical protein